jgi:beta-lactamase class A
MLRALACLVWLFVFAPSSFSQEKTDKKLQKKVEEVLDGFNGQVGVYIKNLRSGKVVAINADTIFPTASMIKLPILIGVMDKLNRAELRDTQNLVYHDSLLYEGVDILGSFKASEKIELGKVVMLMLTMSDNTASLWLQKLAGTGTRINAIMDSLGFKYTRVNSRTPGREHIRSLYGWGQTTPREMVMLMERMVNGTLLDKKSSAEMLRLTSRNYWDDVAISQVPAGIFIASKNGAVDESRSEVLFVNAPNRPYIFCISTKNNKDTSWNDSNEAWEMTRKLSALLWDYFEPHTKTALGR